MAFPASSDSLRVIETHQSADGHVRTVKLAAADSFVGFTISLLICLSFCLCKIQTFQGSHVTADAPYPKYCLDIYLIRFVSRNCLRHNDVIDFAGNVFDL